MDAETYWHSSFIRKQIPNILTLSRLCLGFLFPFLPPQQEWWLLALALGILSEFLDGFLSRRMGVVSGIGKVMDPIADKVFVLAAAMTFIRADFLSVSDFLLIAFRDIFVAAGSLILVVLRRSAVLLEMNPSPLGKLTTTFQLMTISTCPIFEESPDILVYVTGLMSFLSALDYGRRFLKSRMIVR